MQADIDLSVRQLHALLLDVASTPGVLDCVRLRPSQLFNKVPPAEEEPFSTPRRWHAVSDAPAEPRHAAAVSHTAVRSG
jgi:hypothetical protein